MDRTTPDFLGVVRNARPSKYAVTLEAFSGEDVSSGTPNPIRGRNETETEPAFELGAGDVEWIATAQSANPVSVRPPPVANHRPSTETIDELIEGLPFDVQPGRRRPARKRGGGGGPPVKEAPVAPARRPSEASRAVLVAVALLAAGFLVAFAVMVLVKPKEVVESYRAALSTTVALSVAIQPPPPPVREPAAAVDRAAAPAPLAMAPIAPIGSHRPPREAARRAKEHNESLDTDVGASPDPSPAPAHAPAPVRVPTPDSVPSVDLLTGH